MNISLVRSKYNCDTLAKMMLGSIALVVAARISINLPFTPVPLTFQTFTVLLLAMILGSKNAVGAVLLYLGQATLGLPVLGGAMCANPLWILGPTAGYLIGFVMAAYITGKLFENSSLAWKIISFVCGLACIYIPGMICLSSFVGYANAFEFGVLCFMPLEFVKLIALITITQIRS